MRGKFQCSRQCPRCVQGTARTENSDTDLHPTSTRKPTTTQWERGRAGAGNRHTDKHWHMAARPAIANCQHSCRGHWGRTTQVPPWPFNRASRTARTARVTSPRAKLRRQAGRASNVPFSILLLFLGSPLTVLVLRRPGAMPRSSNVRLHRHRRSSSRGGDRGTCSPKQASLRVRHTARVRVRVAKRAP